MFADWQPLDNSTAGQSGSTSPSLSAPASAANSFPRAIRINRPHDDYTLDLQVTKITVNEDIPADRFQLQQPAGTELVRVGDPTESKPL